MIPKRRKRQRSGIRDDDGPLRSPAHLKWIRGHQCLVAGRMVCGHFEFSMAALGWHICAGKIEAAHVRIGGDGGIGVKPGDDRTVPLCTAAHREQHTIGEPAFERRYGINLEDAAAKLAARSPALMRKMRNG